MSPIGPPTALAAPAIACAAISLGAQDPRRPTNTTAKVFAFPVASPAAPGTTLRVADQNTDEPWELFAGDAPLLRWLRERRHLGLEHTMTTKSRFPAGLAATLLAVATALGGGDVASAQADGSLDLDFAGDGIARHFGLFDEYWLTALAADDDLLVAAGRRRSDPPGPPSTPQLHAEWWSLDPSGTAAGRACVGSSASTFPFSFADSSYLEAALIDSAGRLVVGGALAVIGTETQDRALVARFDLSQPGCVADTSFSASGWEIFDDEPPCDVADCIVVDLVEQTAATGAVPNRRYVALVRAITGGLGASRFFLLGLTESGDPDPTFSSDGWTEITHATFGIALHDGTHLAMDPLGRLYVAVSYSDPDDALDLDVAVMRYLASGQRDHSFRGNGLITVSETGADPIDLRASDIAVQPDGLMLVPYGNGQHHWVWVGQSTTATTLFLGPLTNTQFAAQGDGRAILVGDADAFEPDSSRAMRLDTRPSSPTFLAPDPTWGTGAIATYDVDFTGDDAPHEISAALLWNGRLVVGGSLGAGATFVLRAENAYIFADGFEGGTTAAW